MATEGATFAFTSVTTDMNEAAYGEGASFRYLWMGNSLDGRRGSIFLKYSTPLHSDKKPTPKTIFKHGSQ